MPVRRRLLTTVVLVLAGGCAPDWRDRRQSLQTNGPAQFNLVSADVTMAVTFEWTQTAGYGRRLVADVGRCSAMADDDGRSGLAFPLGPSDRSPPRTAAAISIVAVGGPTDAIDLIRAGDKHVHLPEPDGQFSYALMLPLYLVQPFDVLPDRLAAALTGNKPAAPAVVELARDLVDCPAVGVAGAIRGAGLFTARLSLTDAGRGKLRAALAKPAANTRQPPSSEPTSAAAGSPIR